MEASEGGERREQIATQPTPVNEMRARHPPTAGAGTRLASHMHADAGQAQAVHAVDPGPGSAG